MHRGKMVVERQRLNQWIVITKNRPRCLAQLAQRGFAIISTFDASMTRRTEGHVITVSSRPPRWTMVIVATGDDAAMDLTNQRLVDRPIRFKFGNPTIRRQRASRLALRSSLKLLRRLPHRSVQFSFRELRAFDPRGPSHLPFELNLLELLGPTALIWDLRQRQHRCPCSQQFDLKRRQIEQNPLPGHLIRDRHKPIVAQFISERNALIRLRESLYID